MRSRGHVGRRRWNARRVINGLRKHAPAALLDVLTVLVAYETAMLLRFDGNVPADLMLALIQSLPLLALVYVVANLWFGVYWRAWRYGGLLDALVLAQSASLALAVVLAVDIMAGARWLQRPIPISVAIAGGLFALFGMTVVKLALRIRESLWVRRKDSGLPRVLIAGGGEAAQWLVRQLQNSAQLAYNPVCIVDDDPLKVNLRVHDVPIVGTREDIPWLVEQLRIDIVAVATPSAHGAQIRDIVNLCQRTGAKVCIVPGVNDVLDGKSSSPLREVTVEDLLGRDPVRIDLAECRGYLSGRVVLLTGAAGSIGSELARQVLRLEPRELVLLDSNESGLHDLALRLEPLAAGTHIRLAVCSVEHERVVDRLFRQYQPQVVFHAAAYKHVPLMEQHPDQAVLVNVGGTAHVCTAAMVHGTEQVVLISSDKAVNPSNVMGATKRVCEELIRSFGVAGSVKAPLGNGTQTLAPQTRYCAVRFGNVLDSRGSVVPTFNWQIDRGGPITVTHPDMRRYFMTIPEAASLVIQAGAYSRGGEIFLLDMGEEMSIAELAEKMVTMRGLRPGKDVQIEFTGLRPGEKLREELMVAHETLLPTAHPKINQVDGMRPMPRTEILEHVERLAALASSNEPSIVQQVHGELIALARQLDDAGAREASLAVLGTR